MTLPLEKLFQEGVVKPGTVRGKTDVTLAYPDLNSEMAQLLGGFPTRSRMIARPFEIDLLPAESPPVPGEFPPDPPVCVAPLPPVAAPPEESPPVVTLPPDEEAFPPLEAPPVPL